MCFLVAGLLLCAPGEAQASKYTAPGSCTSAIGGSDGKSLVVTTVYCIQQSISSAVYQFVTALEGNLQSYQYMAMAMVFGFYGIKLITGGVDDVRKESSSLLLKMGWAFILIQYATWWYPIGSATMDELIGWVTNGVSGFGGGNTMSSTCPALSSLPPGANPLTYGVWHEMDCMLNAVLGATSTSTDVLTSMASVMVPALVSSTGWGVAGLVAVFATGVMMFMLIKALYSVLLSYLTLAILLIFTPLIAPLLFFNSAYCKDLYERWLGMIMSTIFQPMFIMGFLSFAVQIEATFINGTIDGCVPATYNQGTENTTGSGLCSVSQLGLTGANILNQTEPNATRGIAQVPGDPQLHSDNGQAVSATSNTIKPPVIGGANQFNYGATSIGPPQMTRLKPGPSLQFGESMFAFGIVSIILYELMTEIPQMAQQITLSVGVGFMNVMDPITNGTMTLLGSARGGAIQGLTSGRGVFNGAFRGAGAGIMAATRTTIKGI